MESILYQEVGIKPLKYGASKADNKLRHWKVTVQV